MPAPSFTVRVQAPSEVVQGDRFRVSYVVNTSDVDDFKIEPFEGLVELFGPSRSQSSSFSMVNGKTTSSSSVTFTYTVTTDKAGTFHVPAATVTSGGHTVKSASPSITVLPSGSGSSGNSGQSGQSGLPGQSGAQAHSQADRMHTQNVGDRITNKDIFIAVTASKKRVFEQEAVLLTYKLYTLVNVNSLEGKMPELDGFHVQEIGRQRQPELKMEHYNGKNYGTVVWSQYVVFPQQTGTLTIPEIKYEATIIQQNRSADPFDIFFGGGSMVQEVRKTVMAPAVTLQVDALPTPKPANFSGAVGKFSIKSSLTPQQLKANDATTLRLTVSGTGNMKLMKAPTVAWPKDFESYDPKTEDKTHIGANGSTGSVVYDFITVPRHQGKYTLDPVEFCYFDPDAREYKTVTAEGYTIDVEKGKGGSSAATSNLTKEEVELLGSDIRYIKTGKAKYLNADSALFGSKGYWGIYGAALLVFAILVYVFRRKAVANADLVGRRGRGASKVATKRLKVARKLMQQNNATAFYEETMKALWGYVSDKLNIPVSELTKDNVRERLAEHQLSQELTDQFLATLDECEFARFAPGDPAATMDKIYTSAEQVINQMDNELKIRPSQRGKGQIVGLLLLLFALPISAQDSLQVKLPAADSAVVAAPVEQVLPTKAEADSAYAHEDFAAATRMYQALLAANGGSAQLFFNLGNAYYRQDSIARAILCYERARLLDPSDDDVRFNLEMARSKTVDRVMPGSEMFFVSVFRSIVLSLSLATWTWLAVVAFVLMLLSVAGYLFLPTLGGKKTGFTMAIVALLVCVFANLAAYQQLHQMENRTSAVIMSPSVVVKSTPSTSGTDLFILHEGTRVDIEDNTMNEWMEIRMNDGKEGWIHKSDAEVI